MGLEKIKKLLKYDLKILKTINENEIKSQNLILDLKCIFYNKMMNINRSKYDII